MQQIRFIAFIVAKSSTLSKSESELLMFSYAFCSKSKILSFVWRSNKWNGRKFNILYRNCYDVLKITLNKWEPQYIEECTGRPTYNVCFFFSSSSMKQNYCIMAREKKNQSECCWNEQQQQQKSSRMK